MKAIARSLRITPKKLNLMAAMVRNKKATEALDILRFTPKKSAKILYKVVKSAIANAENNFKQDKSTLYIKEAIVSKAATLKRSVPISRGRMHPILKRCSHLALTIGVLDEAQMKATKKDMEKSLRKGKAPEVKEPTKSTKEPKKKTIKK